MSKPMLNITMPVFNRLELTQQALLALRKCGRQIPFTVTVVDNGSDAPLVDKLIEFKRMGLIDKLFLLGKNIGIAGAANIGWEMTEAPYYMKLDNDIVIKDKDFFSKVFALWAHGEAFSILGGAKSEQLLRNPGSIQSPYGVLGVCANTLAGQAIFVPKIVSDLLGYWTEDHLFGEDADYGLRMHCIGFKQYYYHSAAYWTDYGADLQTTYLDRNLDKLAEKKQAVTDDQGGFGPFMINQAMYNLCIRTWRPVRKYKVLDVSADCRVSLGETEDYPEYKRLLDLCSAKINARVRNMRLPSPDLIFSPDFVQELKEIMKSGGYDCDSYLAQLDAPDARAGKVKPGE